jgi:hypothetical protein
MAHSYFKRLYATSSLSNSKNSRIIVALKKSRNKCMKKLIVQNKFINENVNPLWNRTNRVFKLLFPLICGLNDNARRISSVHNNRYVINGMSFKNFDNSNFNNLLTFSILTRMTGSSVPIWFCSSDQKSDISRDKDS